MRTMGFAAVAFITAATQLLACSSGDTIVAANLLSSNDTQYNGDTHTGSYGGLLDPGIPQNILHPEMPGSPTTLRKAVKVRITISQSPTVTVSREVVPTAAKFEADVLDENGMPVLDLTADAMPPPVKRASHSAIAPSYERFVLSSSFKEGKTQVTAEALDEAGQAFFSAVPATIDLKEGEATAAFLDFKIPPPAPPPASDAGTEGDASTDAGAPDAATSTDASASPDGRTSTDAGTAADGRASTDGAADAADAATAADAADGG